MADKEKPRGDKGGSRKRPPRGPGLKTKQAPGGNGKGGAIAPAKKPAPVAERGEQVRGWWESFRKYMKSVKAEFHRVTWPSKQELRAATIVVIATLFVVTLYLWLVNGFITVVFERITG